MMARGFSAVSLVSGVSVMIDSLSWGLGLSVAVGVMDGVGHNVGLLAIEHHHAHGMLALIGADTLRVGEGRRLLVGGDEAGHVRLLVGHKFYNRDFPRLQGGA